MKRGKLESSCLSFRYEGDLSSGFCFTPQFCSPDLQPYLPQIYVESDMDATNCYLFFQRLALKADLINHFVAHAHDLPDSLIGPINDVSVVGTCEVWQPCMNPFPPILSNLYSTVEKSTFGVVYNLQAVCCHSSPM